MQITGTHFNYYFTCKRELWLFANSINMEHTSDLVYEGLLIHENSYPQRSDKYTEIEIEGIKIDYFDAKNKVIHEIKRSNSREVAHEWQVKYYIFVLERNGISGVSGILEYPKHREIHKITIDDKDREEIGKYEKEIEGIILSDQCPEKQTIKQCKHCSYFDFCWSNEDESK